MVSFSTFFGLTWNYPRITLCNALIFAVLDYADIIWGDKNNIVLMNTLQIIQNKAGKAILHVPHDSSSTNALQNHGVDKT